MSSDFLNDRRRGAEEAFFARQNEALLSQLRGKPAAKQDLSAASGIQSEAVLDHLVERQVGAEGAAALSLIPLVAVAWADGEVSDRERDALMKAAEQSGLPKDTAGLKLFEGWLSTQPPATLLDRWRDYVKALLSDMDPLARDAFRAEVLGKARAVAEAAGGFLGINTVSRAEEDVLTALDSALGD